MINGMILNSFEIQWNRQQANGYIMDIMNIVNGFAMNIQWIHNKFTMEEIFNSFAMDIQWICNWILTA